MYAILSDIHAHSFTLFAKTNSAGVNTRLQIILDEMMRAAAELQAAGGNRMVIAGDLFHTRGHIDPEVLNPVRKTIEKILMMGIDIDAIPGNHDLKSTETQELSSSIQNLAQISISGGQFRVFNKTTEANGRVFIPWQNTHEGLLAELQDVSNNWGLDKSKTDVVIHAGIDGVLSGMPAHGLNHVKLGSFGFRNVFAGHYHNHKDFGNGVVSIGATTHQNWGDIGTKAGFLLVDESTGAITFNRSQAPHFIDISGMDELEMQMEVPGNYARFRGPTMTNDEVKELREELMKMGALGTSIEVPRTMNAVRSTQPAKAVTIAESIEAFVKSAPPATVDPAAVVKRAIETLNESQAVAD